MQVNKKLKFEIVGLTSFGGPVCNGENPLLIMILNSIRISDFFFNLNFKETVFILEYSTTKAGFKKSWRTFNFDMIDMMKFQPTE